MFIQENMSWPPKNALSIKMQEHSAWYSSDAQTIANYYSGTLNNDFIQQPFKLHKESFWGRQIRNQGEVFNHVPIASDISETSASLLFSEAPLIHLGDEVKNKREQEKFDLMVEKNDFFSKLLEGAEISSALGGVYLKIAWDSNISNHPFVVVEQPDFALPEFKFGILESVKFWKTIRIDNEQTKIYRLIESYQKGSIVNELYYGSSDKIGKKVDLNSIPETEDLQETIETPDILLAAYVPNLRPNRLSRTSYLGRSDYLGIEGLMDSLDETYSIWGRELVAAQARILIPESYIRKTLAGEDKFNQDTMLYVKLDIDPVTDSEKIIPQQFDIRAEKFERTALNYLERIVTSAGFSPQTFGLNITGRAESGTALTIRERKTFITKAKKEKYWQSPLQHIIKCMILMNNVINKEKIDANIDISVSFSDSITEDLNSMAESVSKLYNAVSTSIETRVRLLHPEWTEEDISAEVKRIKEENNVGTADNPDNFDLAQLKLLNNNEDEEEIESIEEGEGDN